MLVDLPDDVLENIISEASDLPYMNGPNLLYSLTCSSCAMHEFIYDRPCLAAKLLIHDCDKVIDNALHASLFLSRCIIFKELINNYNFDLISFARQKRLMTCVVLTEDMEFVNAAIEYFAKSNETYINLLRMIPCLCRHAVRVGNLEILENFMSFIGDSVELYGYDCNQLVLSACRNGNLECLKALLDSQHIIVSDKSLTTAFCMAACNNHYKVLCILQRYKDGKISTALTSKNSLYIRTIGTVIKRGYNNIFNIMCDLRPSLIEKNIKMMFRISAQQGNLYVIKKLLKYNNTSTNYLSDALDNACLASNSNIIKTILPYSSFEQQLYSISISAQNGCVNSLKQVVSYAMAKDRHHYDINNVIRNSLSTTANNGHIGTLRYLIDVLNSSPVAIQDVDDSIYLQRYMSCPRTLNALLPYCVRMYHPFKLSNQILSSLLVCVSYKSLIIIMNNTAAYTHALQDRDIWVVPLLTSACVNKNSSIVNYILDNIDLSSVLTLDTLNRLLSHHLHVAEIANSLLQHMYPDMNRRSINSYRKIMASSR